MSLDNKTSDLQNGFQNQENGNEEGRDEDGEMTHRILVYRGQRQENPGIEENDSCLERATSNSGCNNLDE